MAKEEGMGVLERYLGTDIEKIQAADGRMVWATSPCSYIKNAICVVKDLFMEDSFDGGLQKKVKNPFPAGYAQLIGILRWGIELGQIAIALETALMVQYQANPRVGHLE
eukprot:3519198-Ditylum_brightwellii.AAC.1